VPQTRALLGEECATLGLSLDWVDSYPAVLPILPRFFFGCDRHRRLVEAATAIDDAIAGMSSGFGTYLMAVVGK